MSLLRRKRLPDFLEPAYEGFLGTVGEVERAKEALLGAVPHARMPGRPLDQAAGEFAAGLRAAAATMEGWRRPEVRQEWEACAAALREARERGEAAAKHAQAGFEALLEVVQHVLDPLDAFEEADEAFRRLRI